MPTTHHLPKGTAMTVSLTKAPLDTPTPDRNLGEMIYSLPECRPTDRFRNHYELRSGAIKHTNAPIVKWIHIVSTELRPS